MPYTPPPTFVSGAVLTAAQLNILGDDIAYLKDHTDDNPPWHAVQAYRNAAQTLSTGSATAITLDGGENFDTDAFHSTVTNPTRLTLPTGLVTSGKTAAVLLQGYGTFDSNATGYRRLRFLKNGTGEAVATVNPITGVATSVNLTGLTSGVGGDYFEIEALQTSGGNLDITGISFGLVVLGIQA